MFHVFRFDWHKGCLTERLQPAVEKQTFLHKLSRLTMDKKFASLFKKLWKACNRGSLLLALNMPGIVSFHPERLSLSERLDKYE